MDPTEGDLKMIVIGIDPHMKTHNGHRLHRAQARRGMSDREALRCLKRHIGRVLYKTMVRAEKARVASVVRIDFPASPIDVAV